MRYLLLICTDPTGEPYTPEGDTIEQWLAETGPARIDGDRLRPVSDARTVRVRGSQTLVTDVPEASLSAVGGAAVAAGRWGLDRLRVSTSLHTGNAQLPTTRSSAAGPTPDPPTGAGQARSASATPRPGSTTQVGGVRDSRGGSEDSNATSAPREAESTSDKRPAG